MPQYPQRRPASGLGCITGGARLEVHAYLPRWHGGTSACDRHCSIQPELIAASFSPQLERYLEAHDYRDRDARECAGLELKLFGRPCRLFGEALWQWPHHEDIADTTGRFDNTPQFDGARNARCHRLGGVVRANRFFQFRRHDVRIAIRTVRHWSEYRRWRALPRVKHKQIEAADDDLIAASKWVNLPCCTYVALCEPILEPWSELLAARFRNEDLHQRPIGRQKVECGSRLTADEPRRVSAQRRCFTTMVFDLGDGQPIDGILCRVCG